MSSVLVESPHSDVPGGRTARARAIAPLVAAVLASLLLVAGIGDVFLVAVLLGVVAFTPTGGAAPVLAASATLVRWGRSSLDAVTGAQAVLGPALLVGPPLFAASSWSAAGAVLAAAPPGWRAVPFGLLAGLLASGGDPLGRVAGALLGVAAAVGASRLLPRRWAPTVALALGAEAVVVALLARATG